MSDKYTSAEYQNAVRDFVNREVFYCVSSLISHLAKDTESEYYDDILSICVQDDWQQPCLDDGWDTLEMNGITVLYNNCDSLIYNAYSETVESFDNEDALSLSDFLSDPDLDMGDYDIDQYEINWQIVAEYSSLDPHQVEAYEHWIVSDWLASKLESKGEMVSTDIFGLTVWGRTTTGQAILLDRVICDIYDEMMAV